MDGVIVKRMVIKIILASENRLPEILERLEDKIRDLLKKELVEGFRIEDDYTGNSLSPDGGTED